MKNILVLCPMELEKQYFKQALQKFSQRVHLNANFKVVCCGVGKVASATECTNFLSTNSYDFVALIGFAGATSNYQLGELVMPEFAKYSDVVLPESVPVPDLTKKYSLLGDDSIIFTADSFVNESRALQIRLEQNNGLPCLFDMESAAVAQACQEFSITPLVLKLVSDLPEEPQDLSFDELVKLPILSDFTPFVSYLNMLAKIED